MTELLSIPAVRSVLFVLAGVLAGVLAERVLARIARSVATWTQNEWDDVIVHSIRGIPVTWFIAGGAALAVRASEVTPWLRDTVDRSVTVVLIGSVVVAVMRATGAVIERMSQAADSPLPAASLVSNLARLAIGVLGLFLILQNLDIKITPILTALGVGGLAVALALQDTLGNLFAGAQIIVSGQVRPYDYIRLETGEEGYVTDVKGRNTTIRTFPDGNLVVVPNSALASSIVKNFSLPQKSLWLVVTVGVSYDSDLEEVERITLNVARQVLSDVEGGLPDREPVLRYEEFADSSINFTVRLFVREFTDQFRIRHEFIKRLHTRYGQEGIEIPFPIRTVYMQGDASAI